MKASFYLGCTIPVRAQNFELSTRRVAAELGIELIDLPSAGCCGYPLKSISQQEALLASAAILADAEKTSPELVTICTACTGVLTEAAKHLSESKALLNDINVSLARQGRNYKGTVRVRHFARFLIEEVGEKEIRRRVKTRLSNFRFAPHYGCHYLKPSELYEGFDSAENPQSLDHLIQFTGAESVRYRGIKSCCGGACLAVDEGLALSIAKEKLDSVKVEGVDAIVLICPFCSIMYDSSQKKIETENETEYGLPVLFYPQVLGLAMGLDPKADLGFQMNRVKAKDLLDRFESMRTASANRGVEGT